MLENNFICGATSNNFVAKIFGRNFVASKSALAKSSQIGQDASVEWEPPAPPPQIFQRFSCKVMWLACRVLDLLRQSPHLISSRHQSRCSSDRLINKSELANRFDRVKTCPRCLSRSGHKLLAILFKTCSAAPTLESLRCNSCNPFR